jgi:hypothetical protein
MTIHRLTGPGPGRKGVRNKISMACLKDALEAYEKYGALAWADLAETSSKSFLQAIISLMPQELDISHVSKLDEIDDEELDRIIGHISSELSRRLEGNQAKPIDAGSLEVLPALPQASAVPCSGQEPPRALVDGRQPDRQDAGGGDGAGDTRHGTIPEVVEGPPVRSPNPRVGVRRNKRSRSGNDPAPAAG